jgi:O-antigen/teichoic acid export membrane protein
MLENNQNMLKELTIRGRNLLENDALIRRLLSNTGWLFGTNGLGVILGFFQGVLIARMLGVAGYGLLGLITTFVTMVNQLTSFRMSEFVIKYLTDALVNGRKENAATIVKFALITESVASALAFCIIFFLAPLGNLYFIRTPGAEQLILLYAVTIIGNLVFETTTGILQAFNCFQQQSLSLFWGRFIMLILIAIVFLLRGDIWGIMLANIAGSLSTSVLTLWFAFREIHQRLGNNWWRASLKNLSGQWKVIFNFSLSTNLSATLSLITKDSDLLWLGLLRNPIEVGYYKLATSLVGLVQMPVAPLSQVIYPEVAREKAVGNWIKFRQTLKKGTWLVLLYIIPTSMLLGLASPWLVTFFYGKEYVPAITPFLILLVGNGFAKALFWNRPALLAMGFPEYALKISFLLTVVRLVFYIALLPIYGYIGIAMLSSAAYIIGNIFLTQKVLKESKTLIN